MFMVSNTLTFRATTGLAWFSTQGQISGFRAYTDRLIVDIENDP